MQINTCSNCGKALTAIGDGCCSECSAQNERLAEERCKHALAQNVVAKLLGICQHSWVDKDGFMDIYRECSECGKNPQEAERELFDAMLYYIATPKRY